MNRREFFKLASVSTATLIGIVAYEGYKKTKKPPLTTQDLFDSITLGSTDPINGSLRFDSNTGLIEIYNDGIWTSDSTQLCDVEYHIDTNASFWTPNDN